MKVYSLKEKIILIIGFLAIAIAIYLGYYLIIPIVLMAYIGFWMINKYLNNKKDVI